MNVLIKIRELATNQTHGLTTLSNHVITALQDFFHDSKIVLTILEGCDDKFIVDKNSRKALATYQVVPIDFSYHIFNTEIQSYVGNKGKITTMIALTKNQADARVFHTFAEAQQIVNTLNEIFGDAYILRKTPNETESLQLPNGQSSV